MNTNVIFVPVNVNRGRKFRGFGYIVGSVEREYDYGWKHVPGGDGFYYWERNCGVSTIAKIWIPELKKFAYANSNFCETDNTLDEASIAQAQHDYIMHMIESTIQWCKSKKPNLPVIEIHRFARNVLRKQHPEFNDEINKVLPDTRSIDEEITKTLAWATTLVTRAGWIYGRLHLGGKPLSRDRKLYIAKKTLEKRGITEKPGFDSAWDIACKTFNG